MDVRFLPRTLFELSYRRYCGSAPLVVINDYGCTEQYGWERKARHKTLFEADMLALPILIVATEVIRDRVRPGAPLSTVYRI